MGEDRKPYIPMNSSAKLVTEDEQKVEISRRRIAIGLECDKIATLPAGYWPNEWRKHLEHLAITALALVRMMVDGKAASAFDKELYVNLEAINATLTRMEKDNFTFTPTPPGKVIETGKETK